MRRWFWLSVLLALLGTSYLAWTHGLWADYQTLPPFERIVVYVIIVLLVSANMAYDRMRRKR